MALDTVTVNDRAGDATKFGVVVDADGTMLPLSQLATGSSGGTQTAVGVGNPMPVRPTGSTGTDYSANKPTLPVIGSGFGGSGPYHSYVLVATRAANATRNSIEVRNDSGEQIAVMLDDGTATSGNACANVSVFTLAGGNGAGSQGGSWVSQTERGRVQIFASVSTAQVMVREN
jgi:hypothetical protein